MPMCGDNGAYLGAVDTYAIRYSAVAAGTFSLHMNRRGATTFAEVSRNGLSQPGPKIVTSISSAAAVP